MQSITQDTAAVEAARAWLVGHKAETGLSWPEIANLTDVASSTLSLFSSASYKGDNEKVAAKVTAYRNRIAAQAELVSELPEVPYWYDTETAGQMTSVFRWAQSGKIVLIVTKPGIGKTRTAEKFAYHDPNVWLATMSPATAGVGTMAAEVAEAVGLGQITGSPQQLSRKVRDFVKNKGGLIIVDEAQELTDKAINEIRGWHDRTGVGIVLMGNDRVVGQMEGRKSALAQISSRFSIRHEWDKPSRADIDACLDAWNIQDKAQREFLVRVGMMPGALREVTHTLEVAQMAAVGEKSALTLDHLRRAAKQRNVKMGAL